MNITVFSTFGYYSEITYQNDCLNVFCKNIYDSVWINVKIRNFKFYSEHLWRRCLILVEFWSRRYLISSIQQGEKLILYTGAWIDEFMRPEKHWLRMKFEFGEWPFTKLIYLLKTLVV